MALLTIPNRYVTTVRCVCLVLMGLFVGLSGAAPEKVRATFRQDAEHEIRALTEKYFAVYQRKAIEELFAMWSEKATERAATRDSLERVIFPSVGDIQLRALTIRKLTVTGETFVLQHKRQII